MSATVRPIGPLIEKNDSGAGDGDTRPRERLQPEGAAPGGRVSDRSAAVGALRHRTESGDDRRGGTARRATAAAFEVPRVATRRVRRGLAHVEWSELRCHGLAEDREPGTADPGHELVVTLRYPISPQRSAVRRADACGVVEVLDRDRDTVKCGQLCAARQGLLSSARGVERVLTAHGDVGTELRVDALDPVEVHLDELDR